MQMFVTKHVSFLETTPLDYIIGLAYYQLESEITNVNVPSEIPNNTALIIALNTTDSQGNNATININGPGRDHVKTIIWMTNTSLSLHINSNAHKRKITYTGITGKDLVKISRDIFKRNTIDVLTMYTAPSTINIPAGKLMHTHFHFFTLFNFS